MVVYALNMAQLMNTDEPRSYQEAVSGKDKLHWIAATKEELDSLSKNQAWSLIEKPEGGELLVVSGSLNSNPIFLD